MQCRCRQAVLCLLLESSSGGLARSALSWRFALGDAGFDEVEQVLIRLVDGADGSAYRSTVFLDPNESFFTV